MLIRCLFVLCILFTAPLAAQTFVTDNSARNEANFALQNNANSSDISLQEISNANSTVFITQIGDGNESFVNATANQLDIDILQNGANNNIYVNSRANELNQTIIQQGDNHNVVDFSYSSDIRNLELIQSGNNQSIILYGENSISENMKIRMDGESQSLVVRNFN